MKLPGDSDKQNKGVSHEMMQRSLQSQRRVAQRVGLLEASTIVISQESQQPIPMPIPVGGGSQSDVAYAVWGRKVVGN